MRFALCAMPLVAVQDFQIEGWWDENSCLFLFFVQTA